MFATGMANVMAPSANNTKTSEGQQFNTTANNNSNSKVDANDFSTMQYLFQTGNASMGVNQQQQFQQQQPQQQQQKTSIISSDNGLNSANNNNNSSFSPSALHMNTYSGNNSGNAFSFDMDNTTNVNNFSTSANMNASMKKPQPFQKPQPVQKQPEPESNDLI